MTGVLRETCATLELRICCLERGRRHLFGGPAVGAAGPALDRPTNRVGAHILPLLRRPPLEGRALLALAHNAVCLSALCHLWRVRRAV